MSGERCDIQLDVVLATISSGKQKDRIEGLNDLKIIFDKSRQPLSSSILNDKSYHQIFEGLYKAVLLERQAFLKSKKSSRNLETCTEVMRLVVEAAIPKIKSKTVQKLVGHHTQMLIESSGAFCQPFVKNYLKNLNLIFQHSPHVEYLKVETWLETIDFYLDAIGQITDINVGSHQALLSTKSSLGILHSFETGLQSEFVTRTCQDSLTRLNIQDLFQALLLLVSNPNSPISQRSVVIVDIVVLFLKLKGTSVSQINQLALAVVNANLCYIRINHLSFTKSVIRSLIPTLCLFLRGKIVAKDEMLDSTRDEILIFLFYAYPNLENMVSDKNSVDFLPELMEFLEAMKADYSKRSDRNQLKIEDLEMTNCEIFDNGLLHLSIFQLRAHNHQAERNWASLQAIAILERLIFLANEHASRDQSDNNLHKNKRQRTCDSSDHLLESIRSDDDKVKLAGLQVIPFVLESINLSYVSLKSMLTYLQICLTAKNANICVWALLAVASCALQKNAQDVEASEWIKLWQIGTRSLTHQSTCRPASVTLHLLMARDLVKYQDFEGVMNSILFAAESSGPVSISDASICLMVHLLNVQAIKVPGTCTVAAQHVVRWFFGRWKPVDKYFALHLSAHVQPKHILHLLRICIGLAPESIDTSLIPCGRITQAWLNHLEGEHAAHYLLLLDEPPVKKPTLFCSDCPKNFTNSISMASVLATPKFESMRNFILELLHTACISIFTDWRSYITDHLFNIPKEIFRSTIYGCITLLSMLNSYMTCDSESYQAFSVEAMKLATEIINLLHGLQKNDPRGFKDLSETLIQAIQPQLPPLESLVNSASGVDCPFWLEFLILIARLFEENRTTHPNIKLTNTGLTDIDNDEFFPCKASQSIYECGKTYNLPRNYQALQNWHQSFYLTITGKLFLLAATNFASNSMGVIPNTFIDYLLSLTDEEFLSSQKLILDILNSNLVIDDANLNRIIERAGNILSCDLLGRCEVTLALCTDILTAIQPLCSNSTKVEAAESAAQIFHWLLNTAIEKGLASSDAQKRIAKLLALKLHIGDTQLGSPEMTLTTRSKLLTILRDGTIGVKFYVSEQLPVIFELLPPKDHDTIFTNVLESLPKDADWLEGIYFRLSVLTKLGAKLPTLLRRCIYHIFETPSKIKASSAHAKLCFEEISVKLELSSAQEIFKLFASQLLYTWLEQELFTDIPFQIFGFRDLQDLAIMVKEELTALMIMRGQQDAIRQLSTILKIDEIRLINDSFTKVFAYGLAQDLSNAKKGSNENVELQIQSRLGEKAFFQCINSHFVDIIDVFFNRLGQEVTAQKNLMKARESEYAADILERIKSFSSSELILPSDQQPLFKVKYLVIGIKHLCSRTQHEINSLFTPAMLTSLARSLFSKYHPAIGSLNLCSVIRKLRILVSLAGDTALSGYPIEMLLYSLRPFLENKDCVDDTIGIMQYLLDAGFTHLSQTPSFFAGLLISIFGSLRQFEMKNIGILQKDQYEYSKTNIRKFHVWLGKYLEKYNSLILEKNQENLQFRSLIDAAYNVQSIGNADIGTPENTLLLGLLKDELSETRFLNKSSRKIALSMLTAEFRSPISCVHDSCGNDENSVLYASAILRSCQESSNEEYLLWAAKVIGRAFASSGFIYNEIIHESKLTEMRDIIPLNDKPESSTGALLNILKELTTCHDAKVIGIVETALRYIIMMANEDLAAKYKKVIPKSMLIAFTWDPYDLPPSGIYDHTSHFPDFSGLPIMERVLREDWARAFTVALAKSASQEPLLFGIISALLEVPGFADRAFPFIIHLKLSSNFSEILKKDEISSCFNCWLGNLTIKENYKRLLLDSILYLRTQIYPGEKSHADRVAWLEVDYYKASMMAISCGMFKTALLFIEEHCSHLMRPSRRSSVVKESNDPSKVYSDVLLKIYKNIDDPDLYYGVKQKPDWNTVLTRSEYEKDGFKCLAFKGAQFDNLIRSKNYVSSLDVQSLVKSFEFLNLNGVSNSLLQAHQTVCLSESSIESFFKTSRKLEQWDIPVPSTYSNNSVAIYKVFKTISTTFDYHTVRQAIDEGLKFAIRKLVKRELSATGLHELLQTLAALVEIDEIFGLFGPDKFKESYDRFRKRSNWMRIGNLNDVNPILSCRGTTLSILSKRPNLQNMIKLKEFDIRLVEVQTALLASDINRAHNNLQEELFLATSMIDLITPCQAVGINAEAAIQLESANTLWDQGEVSSSIGILQALDDAVLLKNQTITVPRSHVLAKIGNQVSIAKLEKADRIICKYLRPALEDLGGQLEGREAGQVFHQFASFCDQQLQDPDLLEDLERVKQMSKAKAQEVKDYERLIAQAPSLERKRECQSRQLKAKAWLKIDERDLERQNSNREEFLSNCLENYLLSLVASNNHNKNALRFLALWLEHSEEKIANNAVAKHLKKVPSMKFANLMNQLASRLQDSKQTFQELLFQLVMQICSDHPFHGMYQVFAGAYSDTNDKDETAVSRKNATRKLVNRLCESKTNRKIWMAIQSTSKAYCSLAGEKKSRYKAGKVFQLDESPAATNLNNVVKMNPIPSPTRQVSLSLSLDYSKLPVIIKIKSEFLIASGISAPKIITTLASNGEKFKQLVKGGNDDLRQDSIMEQVFEQVNEVLKTNRSTQQRQLSIRTYRVLPLTNIAGIIEFVPNTISLHDYLMPAHERFYPKDLKAYQCRNEIATAHAKAPGTRINVFRALAQKFHPVMRYFFTEKFFDPDEWYLKRLAYIRSTAAISILGHVLGLGDRHASNILLDQESGEIVHIDLGIAFEMGRILPIPETVPFRLTRDIVDGMGITKTEGVFRRCCEFTLEALQKESFTIMSILDVLRYDPLYSWSVSPVRLAKLREEQDALEITGAVKASDKKLINEPGEAARALASISKKLTKILSVYATVNDLINQASDERNLALLFAGWAAYA